MITGSTPNHRAVCRFNAQGNPRRKVVYGDTRTEAAKKLADLLDKFHIGVLSDPSNVIVSEFTNDWIKRELGGKAEKTRAAYKWELNHALRYLSKLRVQATCATPTARSCWSTGLSSR